MKTTEPSGGRRTGFRAMWGALVLLTALAASTETASAQDSFIFASPNTRASLTDEDARASLTSFEESNAIAIADRIACSLADHVQVTGVLGIYDTTAENSLLIESNGGRSESEYAGSLLARYEHQKFVLLFFPQAAGPDRLWTIQVPGSLEAAIAALRQMRLTPLTLRPGTGKNEIWVVDMGGKLGQGPNTLAAQLGGSAQFKDGTAELLGDDDRRKSAAIFDGKIAAFESGVNTRLSSQMWSEDWHDASTRTCSTAAPQ